MTTSELKVKLFQLEIPHYCYSIGQDEEQRLCLIEESGRWIVYYNEDGERLDITEHPTEEAACGDLMARLEL
ncbi:MAG: hypothetical protein J6A16_02635 [Oscillospiraceae bacterium]|nr:hypothetical protein [Oscillospiraceae bacterium]